MVLNCQDPIVKWKIYEYVMYNPIANLVSTLEKIDFLEDDILVIDFMEKFRDYIYIYIYIYIQAITCGISKRNNIISG